jgi:hypothetical protein
LHALLRALGRPHGAALLSFARPKEIDEFAHDRVLARVSTQLSGMAPSPGPANSSTFERTVTGQFFRARDNGRAY